MLSRHMKSKRKLSSLIVNGRRSATIQGESLADYTSEIRFHLAHMAVRAHSVSRLFVARLAISAFVVARFIETGAHTLARGRTLWYDVLISRNHVKANLERTEA